LLGTLNGFATSFSAIGRAAGPSISGTAFTFGIDIGYVIIPWWTLVFFAVLGNVPVWWLREMDGFGGAEDSSSEDEEDGEEDNLLALSDHGNDGGRSSSIEVADTDDTVGVHESNHSQGEDDSVIEEDDFTEEHPLMGAGTDTNNHSRRTHVDPEDAQVSKRTSSPLRMRESVGSGGGQRLSNGIGQSMNEFGAGASP